MEFPANCRVYFIVIVLAIALPHSTASYCGIIGQPQFLNGTRSGSVKIPFEPIINFKEIIYGTTFRWIKNGSSIVQSIINTSKYSLDVMSLIINNVTTSDETSYSVSCRGYIESPSVVLRIAEGSTQTISSTGTPTTIKTDTSATKTTTAKTTAATPIGPSAVGPEDVTGSGSTEAPSALSIMNTTLIVMSVCALGIAVVVAALIITKRRRSIREGEEQLVMRNKDASTSKAEDDDGHEERYVTRATMRSSSGADLNAESDYALIDEALMIGRVNTTANGSVSGLAHSSNTGDMPYANISRGASKRKEDINPGLTYVTLEHDAAARARDISDTQQEQDPSVKRKTVTEYADIDFNKEGFIAPIRKAPSSWYKRKKNKK